MKRFFSFWLFSLLFAGIFGGGCSQAPDKTFTNSIGMEFVLIPAGTFTNTWTEKNDRGEDVQKQRVVTISKPFYLGKYEVTQEEWVAVMGENPSRFKGRTNPVEQVSWNDALDFIMKLNAKEGGKKYRLPTEAEWEHAARAGTDTEWFFGNDPAALGDYAWFPENSQGTTHPVGQKKPNPWGLHDICGNVWEWGQDWWDEKKDGKKDDVGYQQAGVVTDPTGPVSGSFRVDRGGGWRNRDSSADYCRSAGRYFDSPDGHYDNAGFRLAFSPEK